MDNVEGKKDTSLATSILIAGILIAGSIVYLVQSERNTKLSAIVSDQKTVSLSGVGVRNEYMVLGDTKAPITLFEFTDYQCPFCARFYQETLPAIKSAYIASGRIRLVVKDFPLPIHSEALPAAVAARCAGEEGKYWEMHDSIFEHQTELSAEKYKEWALGLGINEARFSSCLENESIKTLVSADVTEGKGAGITGTPGFILGDQIISGACPLSVFENAIQAEEANKNWRVDNCEFTLL